MARKILAAVILLIAVLALVMGSLASAGLFPSGRTWQTWLQVVVFAPIALYGILELWMWRKK